MAPHALEVTKEGNTSEGKTPIRPQAGIVERRIPHMNASLLSTFGVTADDPLLIGRFVFCRQTDELHWVQRWVEVHETVMTTHTKQGEAPVRVHRVCDVEVVDEGDRHFAIVLAPSPPCPEDRRVPSPRAEPHHRRSAHAAAELNVDTDELSSILFRTANDWVDEDQPEAYSSLEASQNSVGSTLNDREAVVALPARDCPAASHAAEGRDEAETIRFRCCDRIECLEMLQAIEHALWLARCRHATTQTVELSEFGRMEVTLDAWQALQSQLLREQQATAALRAEMNLLRVQSEQAETQWGIERTAMEAQFQGALCEAKRRLDAVTRRLHLEREQVASAMSLKHQQQLDALQQQLLAMQQDLEASQRTMQAERDALRRQLAELGTARQAKRQEDAALRTVEGLERFLQMRRDHTSWLRHHLCTEQIARFSLSLKRASQILSRVPGSAQFAREFSHDWPIAARLIELPVMILEEDRMLAKIIDMAANRHQLRAAAGAGLCAGVGTNYAPLASRQGAGKRGSPPPCAAPACGGAPSMVHECSAFAAGVPSSPVLPDEVDGDAMLDLLRARSHHASAEAYVEALEQTPLKQNRRHCERACCGSSSSVAALHVTLKHQHSDTSCSSGSSPRVLIPPMHLSEG